jgi:molybdopterin-containing oxidoreductase family iron-sulfur binding subunit
MNQIPTAHGKKYWRSLDELAATDEFRNWVHREFPVGASEMLESSSRRTLLKLMGASFGLAGLVACHRPEQHILPVAKGVEDYIPGKSYFYATAFPHAGYGSGLLVETHDGRPTKIEGNPDHPFSLGAASAFAQASLLDVYDPDRSTSVLQDGKPVKWEEFTAAAKQIPGKLGTGKGLRFLSERISSPSLMGLKAAVLDKAKYPDAKWVEYDPITNENMLSATQIAFGAPMEPQYRFDKAEVILSLDSDFLGLDSSTIQPVKQFSAKRRVAGEEDKMNRLYVVESQFSLTGANADHRLRMRTSDIPQFAQALLAGTAPATGAKWFNAALKDLQANKGKCIVIAGGRQDVSTHLAVFQLNEVLGNVGETVSYAPTPHKPSLAAFKELGAEMAAGQVSTLVILGGNPVFTAPADLQFEANLKKVALSIHLGMQPDETALAAKWHVPQAHYLESWGDIVAPDGTVSIQQPMIEPLYGGKTALEVVAMLAGNKETAGYEIIRKQWNLPDAKWRKALNDGMLEAGKPAAKAALNKAAIAAVKAPAPGSGLEAVFVPSHQMYDGRYANNGWLHETPDPMTKVVWGNVATLSAATAKSLQIQDGDVISIKRGSYAIELPAMVQPGHADNSLTLSLGYGRTKAGRVGAGVGHNVYPLRATDGFQYVSDVQVTKTGKTEIIATTQNHHTMDAEVTLPNGTVIHQIRPIVREATLVEYRKNPKVIEEKEEKPELFSIYGEHSYDSGYQWGMSIDLNACIGCNACLVACQAENNIPIVGREQVLKGRDMHWIRMDRYYTGDVADAEAVHQPMACQQCQNAPCENVCPVAATIHSPEGLNDMAYNRCVGTRYCANNCPYKVRRFNFLNWHKKDEEVHKMVFNPDVTVRMRGVMEKCNYCVQRIQEKKIESKVAARAAGHGDRVNDRLLKDGDVVSACQQTCPADAIVFGNLRDPDSKVNKLKKQERDYALLAELNVKPRTTYLAKLRNPNPELANG